MPETSDNKGQLDTVTISGVPIFSAGQYPQGNFDTQYLEALAGAYDPKFHEAPNYLSHENADGTRPAGNLALGWIKRLWVSGKTLFADMVDVPKKFAELILAGRIKKRSVEIYTDLSGKGPYLRAVAWPLIPQVKGLADIGTVQVFDSNESKFISLSEDSKKETNMDTQEHQTFVTSDELTLMVHQLRDQLMEHQQKLDCASEVRSFCEQMVLAGKMTPAERATEEPLLVSQRQKELQSDFSETPDRKPLSRQRMDYYRNRPAFLSRLGTPAANQPMQANSPAAMMFAENTEFFRKMGVSVDDLMFTEKVEREGINLLTYQGR